jgi:glutaminyl-peptide cyclotransferase
MKKLLSILGLALLAQACHTPDQSNQESQNQAGYEVPLIGFSVVNTYPHDTRFFTEGLEFHNGKLYESSGSGSSGGGRPDYPSALGVVDLATGKVDRKVQLDSLTYFGEGITFFRGKVYQLTYTTEKGFIYDASNFKKLQEFTYKGEGWALTHDSTRLLMSNGSSNIMIINPEKITNTMQPESILGVTDNNGPVANINELEWVDGYLFANKWRENYILKIDPRSGRVLGKIDLTAQAEEASKLNPNADVLNGIAYNPQTKTFFVTGKLWPKIYEIKLN